MLGQGFVLVGFALYQGVQLVALLLQALELGRVDPLDCFELVAVLFLLVGDLHVLLAVGLLDPELALPELIEQSLLTPLEGLVLLRLAQELLLDANNLVVLAFKDPLDIHDLSLVPVNRVLQVLLHQLGVGPELGLPHLHLVGVAALEFGQLDLQILEDFHELCIFDQQLIDPGLGLGQPVIQVQQFPLPDGHLRAQMRDLVLQSLDLLLPVRPQAIEIRPQAIQLIQKFVLLLLVEVQVLHQLGTLVPQVVAFLVLVGQSILDALHVGPIFLEFHVVHLFEVVDEGVVVGDLLLQLVDCGQHVALVLLVQQLMPAHVVDLDLEISQLGLKVGIVVGPGVQDVPQLDVLLVALLEPQVQVVDPIREPLALGGPDIQLLEDLAGLVFQILEPVLGVHQHSVVVLEIGVPDLEVVDLVVPHLQHPVEHVDL